MLQPDGYAISAILSKRMTLVSRAIEEASGRKVIIKTLRPEARTHLAVRLRHESAILAELNVPGVAKPFALLENGPQPVLVTEDIGGEALRVLVGAGGCPLEIFFPIALELAEALDQIHRRHVVHRDINPGNIIWNRVTGAVQLIDFGLASRLSREQPQLTAPEKLEGTLAYIAPEQTGRMNRAVDYRADFYALGVTFYELLAGVKPFEAQDALEWVHCHIARESQPLAQRRPEIPRPLSALVAKLMAKLPEDRYQSGAGLRADLAECARRWSATGTIAPFTLGAHDVSEQFQLPQKLYGRERELAVLLEAFARAASGRAELALIAGYSGVGKSALVAELHRPIVAAHGVFLGGKFDQYQQAIPYAAVAAAFRPLLQGVLAGSAEEVEGWRGKLQAAVEENGRVLTELLPQAELLIGAQPPLVELAPDLARLRVQMVFQKFIGVFARAGRPLVLFLDDLQWIDAGSSALLGGLMASAELHHLLILGAYRDNELASAPMLQQFLDAVEKSGPRPAPLTLAPLRPAHLAELLAETLHSDETRVEPLAQLVASKTGGNPFFTFQFLTTLHHDGLLACDSATHEWRWDLAEIQARNFTDNVVEFMLGELRALPAETRTALTQTSFLGAEFELRMLALIGGLSEDAAVAALWPALFSGLLMQREQRYRFLHDRVQEAAYALTPEAERAAMHAHIGRLLRDRLPEPEAEEQLFEIASHLNQAGALVADPAERRALAEMNLRAGRKAQAATVHHVATSYLAAGLERLAPEAWETDYALAFELHWRAAECEFLSASPERALALAEAAIAHARSLEDRVVPTLTKINLHLAIGETSASSGAMFALLHELGVHLPTEPTEAESMQAIHETQALLTDRSVERLLALPPMTDPRLLVAMRVLAATTKVAYARGHHLSMMHCAATVKLSLLHGQTKESAASYVVFGYTEAVGLGQYRTGYELALAGREIANRLGQYDGQLEGMLFLAVCTFWARPAREASARFRECEREALKCGDWTTASYASGMEVGNLSRTGLSLPTMRAEVERAADFARKHHLQDSVNFTRNFLQTFKLLLGETPAMNNPDDAGFDWQEFQDDIKHGHDIVVGAAATYRLVALSFAGYHAEAFGLLAKIRPALAGLSSLAVAFDFHLHGALTLATMHDQQTPAEQTETRAEIHTLHAQIRRWAEVNPATFSSADALIAAEIARLEGRLAEAMQLFHEAAERARTHGFAGYEALSSERAAALYRQLGIRDMEEAALRRALEGYRSWGATGKVRQLEERHPALRASGRHSVETIHSASSTQSEIDLLAVVKATQAISREIVRDQLLRTLLDVVLQQSGAQSGVLLLAEGEALIRAATARVEAGAVLVELGGQEKTAAPEMLLSYVRRTREPVLLDDARVEHPFRADPYFATHHPAAVFCLPIMRQSELTAVVYLEHRDTPGVFTGTRLAVLEPLAAQAAISLENAQLFARTQRNEATLRQQSERLALLNDIDRAILAATSLDETIAAALQRISALLPAQQVEIVLYDFERQESRIYGQLKGAPQSFILVHPFIIDEALGPLPSSVIKVADLRHFPQQLELVKKYVEKGFRSALSAPLGSDDRIEGRLSFLAPEIDLYTDADAAIASEVAAQLTIAVRQRQLQEQTQRHASELEQRVAERTAELQFANQELESFSYSISHDLRAPLRAIDWYSGKLAEQIEAHFDEKGQRQFGIIRDETYRMGQLIDDLLAFAKLGRTALRRVTVDMETLAAEVFEEVMREQDRARVEWHLGDLPEANVDPALLRQVWMNLLANAVKYSGKKERAVIEVGGERDGDVLRYRVRDNGAGFDINYAQKLFGVFQRMHDEGEFTGTGVGLAIVQRIVQRHGGTITADSAIDQGATFTFTLPAA